MMLAAVSWIRRKQLGTGERQVCISVTMTVVRTEAADENNNGPVSSYYRVLVK
jgi:hypothetical protein